MDISTLKEKVGLFFLVKGELNTVHMLFGAGTALWMFFKLPL